MNEFANDITPKHLTHPGEILKDELEVRGMTQKELIEKNDKELGIKLPKSLISQIIHGTRSITPKIALVLEYVLGIKASFWIKLQSRYDRLKLLQKTKELRKQTKIGSIRERHY